MSSCCLTSDSRPFSDWVRAWTCGSGVPSVFSVELISRVVSWVMSLSCTGRVAVMPVPPPLCQRVADLQHVGRRTGLLGGQVGIGRLHASGRWSRWCTALRRVGGVERWSDERPRAAARRSVAAR